MVRAVLNDRGLTYDRDVPRLLAGGSRSFTARLASMGKGLVLKPLRKVFRTVFFWMTAHRAARTVVETYFLGRFLHHPALLGEGGRTHLTAVDGRRMARVFEEVSKNLDLRAARNVVGRVGRLLTRRSAKQVTSREMRAAIEEEAPGFVTEFDRLVTQRLIVRGMPGSD